MKHLSEYRDAKLVHAALEEIRRTSFCPHNWSSCTDPAARCA
jgi:hypothetical protein